MILCHLLIMGTAYPYDHGDLMATIEELLLPLVVQTGLLS